MEAEMASRTDRTEDVHELFATAKGWHGSSDDMEAEATGRALAELAAEGRTRRTSGPAPRSLGPIGAVALQHPSRGHEVVLLGTIHSTYSAESDDNPVPGAIRSVLRGLEPCLVVGELDEGRAAEPTFFPQHARGRMPLIKRRLPESSGGGLSMQDPLLMEVFETLGQEAPKLPKLRRLALRIWEESSDARLFENSFYLTAIEASLKGDFGKDFVAAVETAAALGVPLVLGDLPEASLMSEAGLARAREAYAQRRSNMLSLLRSKEAYLRFETARRRLTRSMVKGGGGADLDLLGRCCGLLEPLGAAFQSMMLALTEIRDPFLASAFSEPEVLEVFRRSAGGPLPPLGAAVLGAAHLPGVAASMEAEGWRRLEAPSRGWPRTRPAPARKDKAKAKAAGARKGGKRRGGFR